MRGLNFFVRAMIMEMDLPPHANHTYHTDRQVGACVRISWPIISPKLHQKVDLFIRWQKQERKSGARFIETNHHHNQREHEKGQFRRWQLILINQHRVSIRPCAIRAKEETATSFHLRAGQWEERTRKATTFNGPIHSLSLSASLGWWKIITFCQSSCPSGFRWYFLAPPHLLLSIDRDTRRPSCYYLLSLDHHIITMNNDEDNKMYPDQGDQELI